MMGLDLIVILGIAGVIAYVRGWRPPLKRNQTLVPWLGPSGRELARARYARGEITRDQYHELLSHLRAEQAGEP
jgi:uncharacterized membrane protein